MILLDTQVLVWSQVEERKLSKSARSFIRRHASRNELAISVFSLYELATMIERGRITLHGSIDATLRHFIDGVSIRPITVEIASAAIQFPFDFPRDPGDRLIAATARIEDLRLITADERIQACSLLRTIW